MEALFLATNFEVTQRRALKVFPAATEGIRLWLDGALVLSWEGVKPFLPAPHRPGNPLAQVEVEAGWHRVVVEVVAQSSAPEFGWIVTDEKNHHVIDLKYSARP